MQVVLATRETQTIRVFSEREHLSLAFGSCYGYERTSDIFQTIAQDSPDLFIWTGDAYYVDKSPSIKKGYIVGDAEVRQKGHETLTAPGYGEMLASGTKVVGVWDDHDFGFDNEDKDFKGKHQNREAFLDFVGEPE